MIYAKKNNYKFFSYGDSTLNIIMIEFKLKNTSAKAKIRPN
jgi:hypothetical protein